MTDTEAIQHFIDTNLNLVRLVSGTFRMSIYRDSQEEYTVIPQREPALASWIPASLTANTRNAIIYKCGSCGKLDYPVVCGVCGSREIRRFISIDPPLSLGLDGDKATSAFPYGMTEKELDSFI